jgi:predicted transcriptional regulator
MPRNRAGAQLAINAPPELLERLRAAAAARRQTVTAVVVEAIEAALSGGLQAAAAPAAGAQLLERVAALEAAVAQLLPRTVAVQVSKEEQQPRTVVVRHIENPEPGPPLPVSPEWVNPAPRSGDALGPGQLEIIGARHLSPPEPEAASPERVEPITRTGDALTTAELADQTGTSRGAWNNWAGKAAPGDVRHHPTAGSWRLVGKAPAPGGGPERWLWERVEA